LAQRKPNPKPKPRHITLTAILEFVWTCPHCAKVGRGKCAHTTEYLNAHCGYCGHWCQLDYHRSTDAPEAALKLDNLALGSRTSPAPQFQSKPIQNRVFARSQR
jgi:hypothetical protein